MRNSPAPPDRSGRTAVARRSNSRWRPNDPASTHGTRRNTASATGGRVRPGTRRSRGHHALVLTRCNRDVDPRPKGTRGAQPKYSDLAIETALTLRLVFHLPLRQAESFLRSIFRFMNLDLTAPDHTTLSRRVGSLDVALHRTRAAARSISSSTAPACRSSARGSGPQPNTDAEALRAGRSFISPSTARARSSLRHSPTRTSTTHRPA